MPCYRPQTLAMYARSHQPRRSWLTKEHPDDFKDRNEGFKDPGRRGCRHPEEPLSSPEFKIGKGDLLKQERHFLLLLRYKIKLLENWFL